MPYADLREFIAKLEEANEAQRIEEEVDWNLEAGAMVRRSAEAGLPAPFFQKIKGYPEGYRMFGGTLSKFSRMAIAMDMTPDTLPRELMEEFLRRRDRPIKPVLVNDGPCKENVVTGDRVDVFKFPVPMIHEGDGGRYAGTWHVTASKDLNSEWVNWGMYRHMAHNKNTLGILSDPLRHLRTMSRSYQAKNRPMEVAIAIGTEPISTFAAGYPAPYGVSEVDVAGGLRGEPVQLIKCETVDLAVPATSEIVIEGEISLTETMDEGPFGEFTGYMAGLKEPRSIIHIRAITHRDNPILAMSCMGTPADDNCIMSLVKGAEILNALRARGLPVTGVSVPPEAGYLLVVVAVKVPYPKVADDIAHVVWGTNIGHVEPYIIVVEDDVDPFDMNQIILALATKCHPSRGIVKVERSPVYHLLPFLDVNERKYRIGSKAYFDCTWPLDWNPSDVPQRVSFADSYPPEIQKRALAKWQKYGY